jgi:transketolase
MRALDYHEPEVYSVCYHPESAEVCGLCGHKPLSTVYEAPGSARGLRVAICPFCELLQSLPRDRQGDRKQRLSGGADWGNIRYGKQFALAPALAMIQANAQPAGFCRILDVGSSRGDFVKAMLSLAPQAAITAVEPDDRLTDSYRQLPGVTLLEQRVESLNLAADTYDFMYMSHTLEHVQDPLGVLRQLNRALTASGMIYIEVPDAAFLRSKQLVEEWFIDKHLFHFTESTLRTMASLAGLRIVALEATPQDGIIRAMVKSAGHLQSDHGFNQGSDAGQLLQTYVHNTTANKRLLKKTAQHIHSLARQRPAVIWGGGRLLDLLVKEGELSPTAFDALVDMGLIGKIESVHGLAVCHPDRLPVGTPGFVLIASRAFEAEIRAQVLQRWPGATIASLMGLMDQVDEHHLSAVARKIRVDTIAQIYLARSGHPGGALSVVDILTTLAAGPLEWRKGFRGTDLSRARLVLSKGHACPALYATAAHFGLIEAEQLASLRKLEGVLQGHPHAGSTPFVEVSTGSLGQGFSAAIGMALGLRHQGSKAPVFAVLGDGELQEGEVWEGAMCAAHYRLNRLCAVLDYNRMQSDDTNCNVMGIEPVADKWRAFGWHVLEVDGHDYAQLDQAYAAFAAVATGPTLIVAHTRKGKGVSYMENSPAWHGSATLSDDQFETAMRDLLVSKEETERLRHGRF